MFLVDHFVQVPNSCGRQNASQRSAAATVNQREPGAGIGAQIVTSTLTEFVLQINVNRLQSGIAPTCCFTAPYERQTRATEVRDSGRGAAQARALAQTAWNKLGRLSEDRERQHLLSCAAPCAIDARHLAKVRSTKVQQHFICDSCRKIEGVLTKEPAAPLVRFRGYRQRRQGPDSRIEAKLKMRVK
jgi:hypothetical protein